ncbi:MAG TPA: hypothetical protein VD999_00900 [Vitreimonas sp.]|nr:hypothetical protein [Vitreimonas sp.]
MRKELVIAILIGLSLGLFITYGVYTARTAFRKPAPHIAATPSPAPSGEPVATNIALVSPQDESVQTKKEVTVTGTTVADAFVVIFVNDAETITSADSSGNFSVETVLEPGSNLITIQVIDEDGRVSTHERTVVYLTDALTRTDGSTAEATPSASKKPSATASPTTRPTSSPKVTASPSPKP